jgi:ETC complex I subunit conserved region
VHRRPRGIAQSGSAEVLGTSGRRFESCCPDHCQRGTTLKYHGIERQAITMITARIYRPSRTATQSGNALAKHWVLEFEPAAPRQIDPLMGWTSSRDMKSQVRLKFATQGEAVAYASKNGLNYRVEEPNPVQRKILSYSDNFKSTRLDQWTH